MTGPVYTHQFGVPILFQEHALKLTFSSTTGTVCTFKRANLIPKSKHYKMEQTPKERGKAVGGGGDLHASGRL